MIPKEDVMWVEVFDCNSRRVLRAGNKFAEEEFLFDELPDCNSEGIGEDWCEPVAAKSSWNSVVGAKGGEVVAGKSEDTGIGIEVELIVLRPLVEDRLTVLDTTKRFFMS